MRNILKKIAKLGCGFKIITKSFSNGNTLKASSNQKVISANGNEVTFNGKTYKGKTVEIRNSKVIVDGAVVAESSAFDGISIVSNSRSIKNTSSLNIRM